MASAAPGMWRRSISALMYSSIASAHAGGAGSAAKSIKRIAASDHPRYDTMAISCGSAPPDEPRDFGHALELAPLIVGRDAVAFHRRGEAALRAQRQPLDRHVLGGGLEAPAELVHGLESRFLRGHQPQHDLAVGRHRTQPLEVAGALVVVLEQKPLESALLEHALDRLVAAARIELRLVVAAADVQAEEHA